MDDNVQSKGQITPVAIPGKDGEQFIPSDDTPIYLTESAVNAVKEAFVSEEKIGSGLRVSVVGGGCSGYQYNLGFEDTARAEDYCFDISDFKLFLDPISDSYLRGTVIDFVSGENEHGFRFHNPNPRRRCGCASATG